MNIPNLLTLVRILLIPVFVGVFFGESENSGLYAAMVYLIASCTDILDGIIARRFNMITKLGKILDPLADKLMAATVLVCIAIAGIAPWWAVAIFFSKEILMGLGAVMLMNRFSDVISSNVLGKSATVLFFAVCFILMLFRNIPGNVAVIMISCAIALTIIAFLIYLLKFIRVLKNNRAF